MSSIQTIGANSAETPASPGVDMKLEVVVVPVSDVDRAKDFYDGAGLAAGRRLRHRRRLPRGAGDPAGLGVLGHLRHRRHVGRAGLGSRACTSIVVRHRGGPRRARRPRRRRRARCSTTPAASSTTPGPTAAWPARTRSTASYGSFASFSDPDGNGWLLQEITTRLPGRRDPAHDHVHARPSDLASALRRAAAAHGEHEARTGEADPDWPDWYAEYMVREQAGEELPT